MKYFSYGMNTNLSSMAMRCPKAVSLGAAVLPHYQFEFKSFATVTPKMSDQVHGVLWEISEDCEKSLDRLEGYPTYYGKINVWVEHEGEMVPCMTYLMYPEEEVNYPSDSYVQMLEEGYTSHGISLDQINHALMRLDDYYGNLWLTDKEKDSTIMTSWRSHFNKGAVRES
jgi:gamma-glutamylcyclotransferase